MQPVQTNGDQDYDHENQSQLYTNAKQIYNQQQYMEKQAQVKRLKKVVMALICFLLVVSVMIAYREFSISTRQEDGKFYREQIMGYQLDEFWLMTEKQMKEEQAEEDHMIIKQGEHVITRSQLGRSSWALLHMVTGGFPDEINPALVQKFNAFLILFGQMYPCKLCANHFMQLLKNIGPFQGTTKLQLMTYMCKIHNIVNARLGKQAHSCENIVDQWNSCGCSGK